MSAPELQTITITDFRSIRGTLAVPLSAPVVLIHGTNGAGKSTVMSALELALTGQVAGVDQDEREHLVHRGTERGGIDLKTGDGMVRFDLEGSKIHGEPLLDRTDARFFTERCYLAQRTLGHLLELYESPRASGESALTLFVKELLGLDELDALLEGLHPVGHKRRVQRLVPEYLEAERELEYQRGHDHAVRDELGQNALRLDAARRVLRDRLASLDAPASLAEDLDATAHWLEHAETDAALVELVGVRRELIAMARRAAEVAETGKAKEPARSRRRRERRAPRPRRGVPRTARHSNSYSTSYAKTCHRCPPPVPRTPRRSARPRCRRCAWKPTA